MKTESSKALLLVVSAPSGAGKSTLCNRLMDAIPGIDFSVSCTTRAPRGQERDGEHYHFLSTEEFVRRIEAGDFLEYAEVHGNYYGTLKETVRRALAKGRDLILDIDVQGAAQIRAACSALPADDPLRRQLVDVFVAPPSIEELERRLRGRATDADEVICKRLLNAQHEMDQRSAYAHQIVNDDLEVALEQFLRVIDAERRQRT